MTQKNFMSARALSMEELENVNGGRPRIRIRSIRNPFKKVKEIIDTIKDLINPSKNND